GVGVPVADLRGIEDTEGIAHRESIALTQQAP
ncbi:MAG: hypothetical protein ACI8RZ_005016, partial [Myxococcota bacterium]